MRNALSGEREGALLVAPELTTDILGLTLTAGLVAFQFLAMRVAKPASVGAAAAERPPNPRM